MNDVENGASNAPQDEGSQDQDLLGKHAELIAQLRDKYDEIAVYAAPARFGGIIVASVPENPRVTEAFINAANDSKVDKAVAMRNYALSSVVHPDREAATEIFKKKPFLPSRIAARVSEMAGADAKELGKD
jgi:hypothetical protein